jgi:hypothetical protein
MQVWSHPIESRRQLAGNQLARLDDRASSGPLHDRRDAASESARGTTSTPAGMFFSTVDLGPPRRFELGRRDWLGNGTSRRARAEHRAGEHEREADSIPAVNRSLSQ